MRVGPFRCCDSLCRNASLNSVFRLLLALSFFGAIASCGREGSESQQHAAPQNLYPMESVPEDTLAPLLEPRLVPPRMVELPAVVAPTRDRAPRSATASLMSAPEFATNGVGYSGSPPSGAGPWADIMRSRDRLERFLEVADRGNGEGRLFALCGLRLLSDEDFEREARELEEENPTIVWAVSCWFQQSEARHVLDAAKWPRPQLPPAGGDDIRHGALVLELMEFCDLVGPGQ